MAKRGVSPTRFYVYILFRHDTGTPFYVGKGSRERWVCHDIERHAGRNRHKTAIIQLAKAAGSEIPRVKVAEDLTEISAFALEIFLIATIGRVANGGPLTNLTDGGEGQSGYKHTDETKGKIGQRLKGTKRGPMSEWQKAKISKTKTGTTISREHVEAMRSANLGRKHSPESIAKMSAAITGRTLSDETRQKISKTLTGRTLPAEVREKIKATSRARPRDEAAILRLIEGNKARAGIPLSEETKKKLSIAHTGKIISAETGAKISLANMGRIPSDETRVKLSAWQIGRTRSDEDRQKMRDGWAKRNALLNQQKL